jgi:hypothetical protein
MTVRRDVSLTVAVLCGLLGAHPCAAAEAVPERQALFGHLHVHTPLSCDAYIFGVRATRDGLPATIQERAWSPPICTGPAR